jgi:putative ABC transport system substrate-binding protein
LAAVVIHALPFDGRAATALRKTQRVGMLAYEESQETAPLASAFLREMSRRGHQEGQNLEIIRRDVKITRPDFDHAAQDLVEERPDVIVAMAGTPSIEALKKKTATIPIVMLSSVEPVRDGLIASLGRPGGNVTGNSINGIELLVKRLQMIADIVRPKRIGYLGVMRSTFMRHYDEYQGALASAAKAINAELHVFTADTVDDLPAQFEAMMARGIQALDLDNPAIFYVNHRRIAEMITSSRIPAIAEGKAWAASGLPISYGVDYVDLARKSAVFVDKILKGARPADLPVEQATRFQMVINLKAAKDLGLTVPKRMVLLADEVIRQ